MHKETLSENTRIILEKVAPIAMPFYLAGGTALALELGHRISVDLDFFSQDFKKRTFRTSLIFVNIKFVRKSFYNKIC